VLRRGPDASAAAEGRAGRLKIVSGGQTGVDRAALDVAISFGLPCGGWVPRGRRAEDGPLDRRYPLRETASSSYQDRTRRNVEDSDGTLILSRGPLSGGTALTAALAQRLRRPLLLIDLAENGPGVDLEAVRAWIRRHRIAVLNVAGPRESSAPGIYDEAAAMLSRVIDAWQGGAP
jgi:hypothetical protein